MGRANPNFKWEFILIRVSDRQSDRKSGGDSIKQKEK